MYNFTDGALEHYTALVKIDQTQAIVGQPVMNCPPGLRWADTRGSRASRVMGRRHIFCSFRSTHLQFMVTDSYRVIDVLLFSVTLSKVSDCTMCYVDMLVICYN